ncbi:hypothetical protein HPB51_005955 [Rhipicephalus microplus]|uniref:Uncharacterized protein n=1 Tax=Rhipicephalus microplus TaxID=6941 RepID=A0A9J6E744_RHIMP|nr:hypothetical protein HPB51_005955 [Rhipicephalus microplus]
MTGRVASPTIGCEKLKRVLARLRCRRCCNAGGSGRLVLAAVTSAATCDQIGEQTIDAPEAEDAACSQDEHRPVLPKEYDTAYEPVGKETATTDTSQGNSTEDAQSQPEDMSTEAAARHDMPAHGMNRGINTNSVVERPLEKSTGTAHESKAEGPQEKATLAWRSGLRARSNLPVDRPVGTSSDQQLTDDGPLDGPGDV